MSILDQFKYRERVLPTDDRWRKLRAEIPTIADLLLGHVDEGTKAVIAGGTLMFYADDGVLKWTYHHKQSRTTFFGTFPDLMLSLEDVELALLEGKYEKKKAAR